MELDPDGLLQPRGPGVGQWQTRLAAKQGAISGTSTSVSMSTFWLIMRIFQSMTSFSDSKRAELWKAAKDAEDVSRCKTGGVRVVQGRCTRQYLDILTSELKQPHPSKLESRYERDDGHQRYSEGNVSLGMCPVGPCSSGYTVLFLFALDRLPGVTGIVGFGGPSRSDRTPQNGPRGN